MANPAESERRVFAKYIPIRNITDQGTRSIAETTGGSYNSTIPTLDDRIARVKYPNGTEIKIHHSTRELLDASISIPGETEETNLIHSVVGRTHESVLFVSPPTEVNDKPLVRVIEVFPNRTVITVYDANNIAHPDILAAMQAVKRFTRV